MQDSVLVSGKSIDENQLTEFLEQLEQLTGAEVVMQQQWVLWSESSSVMTALKALFGGVPAQAHGVTPKPDKPAGRPAPVENTMQLHPGPNKELRVWEVHVPGVTGRTTDPVEKLTITEKNTRLVSGQYLTGTLLRHPKGGWSQISGAQGTGQGMTEITAADAIAILDQAARG